MDKCGRCMKKCFYLLHFARSSSLVALCGHSSSTCTLGQQNGLHSDASKISDIYVSEVSVPCYLHSCNKQALAEIMNSMVVYENFLTESEEGSFLEELEPYMKRLRYEFSHWDDAIHGYRETEKSNWNGANKAILKRVSEVAFSSGDKLLRHVHVLDINKEGYIKPHVDSVRFCGDTIAGLSLMSSSIMRLICEQDKEKVVDVLLKQRSLYIMKGEARYKYTHEILPDKLSCFKSMYVPRDRRMSIICRNEPQIIQS